MGTPSGTIYTGQNPPEGSIKGILYPLAGTLRGCASHNMLITVYPNDCHWENIATITGDSSWTASNTRTYFERLERCKYLPNSIRGHGCDGWLETNEADVKLVTEGSKIFSMLNVAAARSMLNGVGQLISPTRTR
ncbi:hypothetical protein V1527DRAFT_485134 [Lipomyces starkeyi]